MNNQCVLIMPIRCSLWSQSPSTFYTRYIGHRSTIEAVHECPSSKLYTERRKEGVTIALFCHITDHLKKYHRIGNAPYISESQPRKPGFLCEVVGKCDTLGMGLKL